MSYPHPKESRVQLGVVPTHLGFSRSLIPGADGRLPRATDGRLTTVAGMDRLRGLSPVRIDLVQVSTFPGCNADDMDELISQLRAMQMEVDLVLMVAGVNPLDPADEDAVLAQIVPGLRLAVKHEITRVASTSIEGWMDPTESRREGADFDAAVEHTVSLHLRAIREAGLEGSCIGEWHMEFLRPGEFRTFTCLDRCRAFVSAANQALGRSFFKVLVDTAHCGDSGLSLEENAKLIRSLAADDELGMLHASARTTRGSLTTDAAWIGSLLRVAEDTGRLRQVLVEIFDHTDPALELLRALGFGFGIDTRDGRSYEDLVVEGLAMTARHLGH
jgi:hypothetical protein